jgi:hypothetical protein
MFREVEIGSHQRNAAVPLSIVLPAIAREPLVHCENIVANKQLAQNPTAAGFATSQYRSAMNLTTRDCSLCLWGRILRLGIKTRFPGVAARFVGPQYHGRHQARGSKKRAGPGDQRNAPGMLVSRASNLAADHFCRRRSRREAGARADREGARGQVGGEADNDFARYESPLAERRTAAAAVARAGVLGLTSALRCLPVIPRIGTVIAIASPSAGRLNLAAGSVIQATEAAPPARACAVGCDVVDDVGSLLN